MVTIDYLVNSRSAQTTLPQKERAGKREERKRKVRRGERENLIFKKKTKYGVRKKNPDSLLSL